MDFVKLVACMMTIITLIYPVSSLFCYQCVSTHPGCGQPFKWYWYQTKNCADDDVCVKVIEKKDGQEIITRDCLSQIKGIRTDIPSDHYEGCRSSTVDVKLANYVNNSVKEMDIKRDYYDSVTFCFCFLDNWCNGSSHVTVTNSVLVISVLCSIWKIFFS